MNHAFAMRSCLQQIYRHRMMGKPPGRPINYEKHQGLVDAFEAAKAKGDYALDRLVIREGYAHRDSLLKAYKLAKAALAAQRAATSALEEAVRREAAARGEIAA